VGQLGIVSRKTTPVILETARLVLSPITLADSPDAYPIFGDPDVMAHWDVAEISDPDLVDQMIAGQAASMDGDQGFYWSIRRLDDHALVGLCDLSDIDQRHHRAEVGFILGKSNWGQGYALEAMQAVGLTFDALIKPVHVPRERPPVVVVDEGPLVLVETRKDLGQVTLPFEAEGQR
jgi:hypothetical protein